jgi:hypothetical protein
LFAQAARDFLSAIELANQMAAKRFTQRAARSLQNLLRERASRAALHSR